MNMQEAQNVCKDELVANITRCFYHEKAHALKVMKAVSVAYNMVGELQLVTETTEDYFGKVETRYKIALTF